MKNIGNSLYYLCNSSVNPKLFQNKKFFSQNRVAVYPAIPLLGIYPNKNIIQKDTCTPMFIAALFTIAKTWKQPVHGRRMDKENVVCIYHVILLSHKREWNNAICSNTDGPRDYHTKWSKPEKDKYHMISLICGI